MSNTKKARPRPGRIESSELKFHQGNTLSFLAGTYPTILDSVLELVQNAVDVLAKNIWLSIDFKTRKIVVSDDGEGVSRSEFDKSLASVALSRKERGKYGRYGLGLISPLGKCRKFTFLSTPKSNPNSFVQWEFDSAKILSQGAQCTVPNFERPDVMFSRTKGVPWRTQLRIENFRRDIALSRISRESLTQGIQDRYSLAMVRRGVVVHTTLIDEQGNREDWDILGKEYRGHPLKVETFADPRAGHTIFKLFLANKGKKGYKGKVVVGEDGDDFRFDFETFAQSLDAGVLSEEVVRALSSGVFEGEILTGRATLNQDRKSFNPGDALEGFCKTIDTWFEKVGHEHLEDVITQRREEKYQSLGIRSLRVLRGLVESDTDAGGILADLIGSFKVGTTGAHHAGMGKKEIGEQDTPSLSTHLTGMSHGGNNGEGKVYDSPERTYEGHQPWSVLGPKGHRRKYVRDDSIGLQFTHVSDLESMELYKLDTQRGILTFNNRHHLWAAAEGGGDFALMRFQECVAVFALHLQLVPEPLASKMGEEFLNFMKSYVFVLANGDKLAGRKTINVKA